MGGSRCLTSHPADRIPTTRYADALCLACPQSSPTATTPPPPLPDPPLTAGNPNGVSLCLINTADAAAARWAHRTISPTPSLTSQDRRLRTFLEPQAEPVDPPNARDEDSFLVAQCLAAVAADESQPQQTRLDAAFLQYQVAVGTLSVLDLPEYALELFAIGISLIKPLDTPFARYRVTFAEQLHSTLLLSAMYHVDDDEEQVESPNAQPYDAVFYLAAEPNELDAHDGMVSSRTLGPNDRTALLRLLSATAEQQQSVLAQLASWCVSNPATLAVPPSQLTN